MRIVESGIYPHPILREESEDFREGNITFNCSKNETDTEVNFEILSSIDEEVISKMIKDGSVAAVADIECQDTYFSQLSPINIGESAVSCPRNELSGSVEVRMILYSTQMVKDFFSPDFHNDYGKEKIFLRKGELLGFSHIFRFIFDHPRISYSQIFELVKSEDDSVLEMEYQIGIDNPEKIQIIAGAKIHNIISENRLTVWGKTLNLSSVFSQCIVEAIHLIRQNPGEHEYKKWYKVLDQSVANCGFGSGLDDSSLEILRTAQKLFSNPYYEADHTIKELLDEQ